MHACVQLYPYACMYYLCLGIYLFFFSYTGASVRRCGIGHVGFAPFFFQLDA